jgi:hypothetical protein
MKVSVIHSPRLVHYVRVHYGNVGVSGRVDCMKGQGGSISDIAPRIRLGICECRNGGGGLRREGFEAHGGCGSYVVIRTTKATSKVWDTELGIHLQVAEQSHCGVGKRFVIGLCGAFNYEGHGQLIAVNECGQSLNGLKRITAEHVVWILEHADQRRQSVRSEAGQVVQSPLGSPCAFGVTGKGRKAIDCWSGLWPENRKYGPRCPLQLLCPGRCNLVSKRLCSVPRELSYPAREALSPRREFIAAPAKRKRYRSWADLIDSVCSGSFVPFRIKKFQGPLAERPPIVVRLSLFSLRKDSNQNDCCAQADCNEYSLLPHGAIFP